MSILIKGIPLGGYEISIMKDGERYRARVDGIWCEVEEIQTTEPDADTISRAKAIDAVKRLSLGETDAMRLAMRIGDYLERLSPAQLGANLAEVGTDCISRQAAIEVIDSFNVFESRCDQIKLEQMIGELPPAEPERIKGHWIEHDDGLVACECSVCHEKYNLYEEDVFGRNFCPNCGAKMEVNNESN